MLPKMGGGDILTILWNTGYMGLCGHKNSFISAFYVYIKSTFYVPYTFCLSLRTAQKVKMQTMWH